MHTAQSAGAIEYINCKLCREVRYITPPPTQRVSWYDTKPSNSEAPILKFWGMKSTPLLPLLNGPL